MCGVWRFLKKQNIIHLLKADESKPESVSNSVNRLEDEKVLLREFLF